MRWWSRVVAAAAAVVAFGLLHDGASAHLGESLVTETWNGIGMIVVAAGAVAVGAWLLGVRHRPAQRIKHSRADEPKAPRTSKPKRRSSGRGRRL